MKENIHFIFSWMVAPNDDDEECLFTNFSVRKNENLSKVAWNKFAFKNIL